MDVSISVFQKKGKKGKKFVNIVSNVISLLRPVTSIAGFEFPGSGLG
jgi:hypothetical protein